ncbi:MAG: hypothetical protein KAS01_00880 [Candidatus Pacebacteria bacterium]|nr:hypothetical protein [Candidatus Paceibacterota bacterium]
MRKQKIIFVITVLTFFALTLFFAFNYSQTKKELDQTKTTIASYQENIKVIDFTELFVEEVLNSGEGEIDFEIRLQLENSVRELGNEEILSQWKKFIDSEDETEAQGIVKELLNMLVDEMKVK